MNPILKPRFFFTSLSAIAGPMTRPPQKRHFTITEAAKELRVTRAAVHGAIKRGKLKATWGEFVQVAEGWRITPESLHDYEVSLSHQERGKKTSVA